MRYFGLDDYDKEEHNAWGNIMQYTGLQDKNGVEIYEKDIVRGTDCVNPVNGVSLPDEIRCVKYQGSCFIIPFYARKLEVIGNIYENKEFFNEPYKCRSYYDGELKNCTCGECDKIIK
jgi:hypothetical protein